MLTVPGDRPNPYAFPETANAKMSITPLRLLIFSDIHNDWQLLEDLLAIEADYYIAAGDQATWSKGVERCGEILQTRGDRVYVLPGNHETADQVASMAARYGLHDLHGQHFQAGRWHIAGLGYSNPTPFNTPGEYSEPQIHDRLLKFADLKPLVLVCHAPPFGTALDRIRPGLHGGSTAVKQFIETYQPEHFICGHIHEASGTTVQIGSTRATNAGKKGYLLELDEPQ
jgi:Icc-related predicted phosphoesterase